MDGDRSAFAQHRTRAPDGAGWLVQTGWEGSATTEHRGFPSCSVGIVVSFTGDVSVTFEGRGTPSAASAFVAGMHVSPVHIREPAPSHGIQIKLRCSRSEMRI